MGNIVSVDHRGRMVLPAKIRKSLIGDKGGELVIYYNDGEIIMKTRKQQVMDHIKTLQETLAEKLPEDAPSVADILIAERRAENAWEMEKEF